MHDFTEEQVLQSKRQSRSRKSVKIQKFCSYDNLTAHFSSLLNTLVKEADGKERKRAISFPSSLSPRCRSSLLRPFCNRLRERQETTEDQSAGTNQCKDVTFRLLNKKINLVPVNLCVLFQMTQRYRTDDSVTQLLDKIDFVILPVFNVDGYSYTWIDPVMIFFSYISLMLTID